MCLYGRTESKYTSDVCHSLKISSRLDFKKAEYDDFWNFKTTFRKNYIIQGETETRNVYSIACRSKICNCCSSVFFFLCWPVLSMLLSLNHVSLSTMMSGFSFNPSRYGANLQPFLYNDLIIKLKINKP